MSEASLILFKDIITAIKNKTLILERRDIRFIVDLYYQIQEYRKSSGNQSNSIEKPEPSELIEYIFNEMFILEKKIKTALDKWTDNDEPSSWAKGIYGIGPILSAGLAAHIDMAIATNVAKIWRFAGLDPTCKWNKGQKRPWNARLKVLCWKIGDSFVKVSGNPKSFYGKVYRDHKELYVRLNEEGKYADVASQTLNEKCFKKDSGAKGHYEKGKLPPGRIDLRARRKAVKLFLSHWWEVSYRCFYKKEPPEPYVIAHLKHTDLIRAQDVVEFEKTAVQELPIAEE